METKKTKKQKLLTLTLLFLVPTLIVGLVVYQLMPRKESSHAAEQDNFNKALPSPAVENGPKNKLEAYLKAQNDSLDKAKGKIDDQSRRFFNPGPPDQVYADQYNPDENEVPATTRLKRQEKKMNEQLAMLDNALRPGPSGDEVQEEVLQTQKSTIDISQLEQLMMTLQNQHAEEDPELKRAERIVEMIAELKKPSVPIKDTASNFKHVISNAPRPQTDVFYGLEPMPLNPQSQSTAIKAITTQDQLIFEGSVITLMLEQDIYIEGQRIPAGTLLDGLCSFGNERIQVSVNKLVYNGIHYPIKLKAFDLRGNEGIYVPGLLTPEAAKATANEAIQSLNIATLDQNMSTQAITTAIQGLKGVINRKTSKLKATVKADIKLFLL